MTMVVFRQKLAKMVSEDLKQDNTSQGNPTFSNIHYAHICTVSYPYEFFDGVRDWKTEIPKVSQDDFLISASRRHTSEKRFPQPA